MTNNIKKSYIECGVCEGSQANEMTSMIKRGKGYICNLCVSDLQEILDLEGIKPKGIKGYHKLISTIPVKIFESIRADTPPPASDAPRTA